MERARPAHAIERWFPLLFLACAFAAAAMTFVEPRAFADTYDWRYFETWVEAGRRSIAWYHQFPLWNPWTCGGQVYLANPQSLVTAPTFLLPLLFGTALGLKLQLVAYLFCAFDGMYRLARREGLEIAGALFASVLFGAGGWLALHLCEGHCTFAGAALFPYLVLCHRRALDEREWLIPLGALAAWIVALGGTSTPPMAMVLLATVAGIDAFRRRSLAPFLNLLVAGAVAALIGAVRIFPALQFVIDHPRHLFEADANSIFDIIKNGYLWRGVESVRGKRYWFHEYGYRLSYLTPPLILWSLTVKRTRSWWIVVVVGASIVAGAAIPYGPWWLMSRLPIFRDLRVPSRYALLIALAIPILCGGALDDLRARWERRRPGRAPRVVALVVVALALLDGLAFDAFCFHKVFDLQMPVASRGTRFFQLEGDWRSMMNVVLANHGAIKCDEEAPLERALELDLGDVAQARLLDPSAGSLAAIRWTPNRVEVDLDLSRPTTVMFNQNWNEHWRATSGKIVRVGPKVKMDRDGGRLGVLAPAGRYTLSVYYRPKSFVAGLWVSLFAIPLALVLFVEARRRRARP